MSLSLPGRGAHAAPHRRGARAPRIHRPVTPVASLEPLKLRILASLASGPKTLGEISNYHVTHIKAAIRDEAIAELLKAGRVRLVEIPHPGHYAASRAMRGIALAKGVHGA